MAFERFTIKKIYYYVICALTLFVLMWGTVDVVSSLLSITLFKPPSVSMENQTGAKSSPAVSEGKMMAEPFFEEYYQSRMTFDRIGDSLARLIVAGCIFLYSSSRIKEIEGKEI